MALMPDAGRSAAALPGAALPGAALPGDGDLTAPTDALVSDVFDRACTSRAALEDVGSRWGILTLLALGESSFRFNALRRKVAGVSEKMLAQTLQSFERDGLVTREVLTTIPPRVEYTLTPLGARVAERLRDLADLLEGAAPDIGRSRQSYDTRTYNTHAGDTRVGDTRVGDT